MVMISIFCLLTGSRQFDENNVTSTVDKTQVWGTAVINAIVLCILWLLRETSDNQDVLVRTSDSTRQLCPDPIAPSRISRGTIQLVVSCTSLLMPMQGIYVCKYWFNVPMTQSHCLGTTLNAVFIVGALAYVVSLLLILKSSMSRPVRASWALRKELISKLQDSRSKDDWQARCKELKDLDVEFSKIWAFNEGGGVWYAALAGSCLLFGVAAFTYIQASRDASNNGGFDLFRFVSQNAMVIVYFVASPLFCLILGLVLASVATHQPFAVMIPGPCGKQWDVFGFSAHEACVYCAANQIDLAKLHDCEARIEHMRFAHAARHTDVGAKFFGCFITKAEVFRMYAQVALKLPAIFIALQSAVASPENGTTTVAPTNVSDVPGFVCPQ